MRSCSTSQTTRTTVRPSNYCATMVGTRARSSYYIRARALRLYWTQVSRVIAMYMVWSLIASAGTVYQYALKTRSKVANVT